MVILTPSTYFKALSEPELGVEGRMRVEPEVLDTVQSDEAVLYSKFPVGVYVPETSVPSVAMPAFGMGEVCRRCAVAVNVK